MRSSTVGATALTLGLGGRLLETNIAMYQSSHPVSTSINGMGTDMIDGSGTINPAALNTPGIKILPLHIHSYMGSRLDYRACSIGDASAKPFCLIARHEGYNHVITRDITKGVTNAGASTF